MHKIANYIKLNNKFNKYAQLIDQPHAFEPKENSEEELDEEKAENESEEVHQGMTEEDLESKIKDLSDSESILAGQFSNPAEAAKFFVSNYPNMKAGHCWDWVKKIYDASGFTMGTSWQDLNYTGKIAGNHRASPSQLQSLQPGDWIYINNRNQYDTHGNHSVIFLGWKGPNIAEVASYYDNSSHIHSYNVNEYPVTHITKFVQKPIKLSNKKIDNLIKLANYFYNLNK